MAAEYDMPTGINFFFSRGLTLTLSRKPSAAVRTVLFQLSQNQAKMTF